MSKKINISEDNIKCKYGEIITTFKTCWEQQDVYYDAELDRFLEARYHEEYLDTGTVYDGCFSISDDTLWNKLVDTCDEEGMRAYLKILGKNTRVGLFTWEDIVERLHDTVKNEDGSYSKIEGIVFDPGVNNTVLSAEEVHEMNSKMNAHSSIEAIQESNSKVNESVSGFLCDKFDADNQRARRYCKASVILGVLSMPFGITFIPPVLAVVYGLIGQSKTGSQKEANDALAGIILGSLSIVINLWLLLSVF